MTSHYTRQTPLANLYEEAAKPKIVAETPQARQVIQQRITQPYQGFGSLWRKTYRVNLGGRGLTPEEVITEWKQHFDRFWPAGNYFYEPLTGLRPGEVALVRSDVTAGLPLSTGMVVVESGPTSFTLATTKGHPFAGRITFRAYQEGEDAIAEVRLLARSADPLTELAMNVIGHDLEDDFWQHTLRALAAHFRLRRTVQVKTVCADPNLRWRRVGNIQHNPFLSTASNVLENPAELLAAGPRLLRVLSFDFRLVHRGKGVLTFLTKGAVLE